MKSLCLLLPLLLVCGCQSTNGNRSANTGAPQPRTVASASDADRAALLDRVKQLEGRWEVHAGEGVPPGETVFAVTSAGSSVREIMFPGTDHEMTNMYHMDGPTLVMTHYCAAGNQPRMRAVRSDDPDVLRFEYDSVTNMTSAADHFMGSLVVTFVDADTIRQDWTSYKDGTVLGTAGFQLRRKR